MVQINNLMSDIWKVFGFIIAGALAVNAVQAAMGLADFAYWHLEKPCARDPRSPVPLTLAVQNSLTL